MKARRILDVIADILTLLVLFIAGVGHFLPWLEIREETYHGHEAPRYDTPADVAEDALSLATAEETLIGRPSAVDFQIWHAVRSGTALAVAAVLVGLSLTLNFGVRARKVLVLMMFASVLLAIAFQIMIYTPYPITEAHRQVATSNWRETEGHLVALIPSVIAGVLCLARMGWTMTASPVKLPRTDHGLP